MAPAASSLLELALLLSSSLLLLSSSLLLLLLLSSPSSFSPARAFFCAAPSPLFPAPSPSALLGLSAPFLQHAGGVQQHACPHAYEI